MAQPLPVSREGDTSRRASAQPPRSSHRCWPSATAICSKRLRVLAAAGVPDARREGWYVLYSLDRTRLRSLQAGLAAHLWEAGSGAGA